MMKEPAATLKHFVPSTKGIGPEDFYVILAIGNASEEKYIFVILNDSGKIRIATVLKEKLGKIDFDSPYNITYLEFKEAEEAGKKSVIINHNNKDSVSEIDLYDSDPDLAFESSLLDFETGNKVLAANFPVFAEIFFVLKPQGDDGFILMRIKKDLLEAIKWDIRMIGNPTNYKVRFLRGDILCVPRFFETKKEE